MRKELVLGVVVPTLLAVAAVIAGWALTKTESGFPEWAPTAAFVAAGVLALIAVAAGVIVVQRRALPRENGQSAPARVSHAHSIVSHEQSGGITAHTVNTGTSHGRR